MTGSHHALSSTAELVTGYRLNKETVLPTTDKNTSTVVCVSEELVAGFGRPELLIWRVGVLREGVFDAVCFRGVRVQALVLDAPVEERPHESRHPARQESPRTVVAPRIVCDSCSSVTVIIEKGWLN